MPIFRRFRSSTKFMEFISSTRCTITVDSFTLVRHATRTWSVGTLGDMDEVIRIEASPHNSSRSYYYDLVISSRFGSTHGWADNIARDKAAIQRVLTAIAVREHLLSLGHEHVTLMNGPKPMEWPMIREAEMAGRHYGLFPVHVQLG